MKTYNDEHIESLLDAMLISAESSPRLEQVDTAVIHPFEGHPYQVRDDAEMDDLVESIRSQGVLTPLVIRPMENGEYEIISGHRRLHACKKAGIEKVPALIYSLDRDAAAIALVDSNLHREHILPSEKAFAYKLKADALRHQGQRTDLTSVQVAPKLTTEQIAEDAGVSKDTVKRYIRLTNLDPGILQKVDEGRIAFTPAVELSYLTPQEQTDLLETMESEDCTPSLTQAIQLKQASLQKKLDMDMIFAILRQAKANQQEKITLKVSELRKYFPANYSTVQMTHDILKGLELLKKQRSRSKDAR